MWGNCPVYVKGKYFISYLSILKGNLTFLSNLNGFSSLPNDIYNYMITDTTVNVLITNE